MAKIPKFKSEKQEAHFWATHDSTDYLRDTEEADVKFTRPRKKLVSLRLDEKTIKELKEMANKKKRKLPYQVDTSKIEFSAFCSMYSAGVRSPRES